MPERGKVLIKTGKKKRKQTWKKVDDLNGKKVHVCKAAKELLREVLQNEEQAIVFSCADTVLLVRSIWMCNFQVFWNTDVGCDNANLRRWLV